MTQPTVPTAPSAAAPRRPGPPTRASDAERERAAERLRRHAAAGRLELDELEERVGRAFAARTREDLHALLADLPRLRERPRRPRARAVPPIAALATVGFLLGVLGAGDWLLWSPFALLAMIPASGRCSPGR